MLAGSGVSPGSALRDLNELHVPAAPALAATAAGIDTGPYATNLQSQSTLAIITESLNRSARDFDAFLERTVTIDWDAQRQRIYEHFGLVPKGIEAGGAEDAAGDQRGFGRSAKKSRTQMGADTRRDSSMQESVFGASNFQRSVIGSPAQGISDQATLFTDTAEKASGANVEGLDDRYLREKERKYASRVQGLNAARLEGRFCPVLRDFGTVEGESGGEQVC